MKDNNGGGGGDVTGKIETKQQKKAKPLFRPAPDDTKPFLKDPILRADPIETEEAVLRLPPFPAKKNGI